MQIIGSPLHKGQQRIIDLVKANHKYIVVNAGRQNGKSFLATQLILHWALNNEGAVILVVAPVYAQLKRPFEELIDGLHGSKVIKDANKSEFIIRFANKSKVIFKSAERPDSMRGLTADFCIMDEAAYMNESVWSAVVKPILLVKGKQVLFISTPRGRNWFYDIYNLGQSDDHTDYVSATMNYNENPFVDLKEIEEAKLTLPEHIFNAEYLAQFEDSGDTVFSNLDACTYTNWPRAQGKIYAGLDLGRANDYTVLTVIDETGKVLEIYRDNKKDWATMLTHVLEIVQRWNAYLMVESNSIGDVIIEQLKKQWRNTVPFTTTSQSKQMIIENLIMDFNAERIKIPSNTLFPHLRFELDVFSYTYSSKSRSVHYSAPFGLHDDCVMSLAIANHHRKSNSSRGSYSVGGIKL
jgi:PBSX family phage terminase large subunit